MNNIKGWNKQQKKQKLYKENNSKTLETNLQGWFVLLLSF